MHTLLEQHKETIYSLLPIFICLWICLGFLWSVVLLITLYLLEPIFKENQDCTYNKDYTTIDTFSRSRKNSFKLKGNSPKDFWTKERLSLQALKSSSTRLSVPIDRNMFTSTTKTAQPKGDMKPSLMSLIHGRSNKASENYTSPKQPIVALVKNNVSLRKPPASFLSPKRPLYENYMSPLHNHVFSQQSPSMRKTENDKKDLSLHGTYLVNKSIFSPNLTTNNSISDEDKHAQLSKNFTRIDHFNIKENIDTTSTDSVVSILKQKSKRKRSYATQSPTSNESSKKTRFNELTTANSTLDDLFSLSQKRLSSRKRAASLSPLPNPKKPMVSISTQFDSPQSKISAEHFKQQKTKKIGLSEKETNDLMINENGDSESENQNDRLSEKSSRDDIPASEKSSLQDSMLEETDGNSSTTTLASPNSRIDVSMNNSTNLDISKNINNSNLNVSHINRSASLSSSLKNLKSPFKRIVPETLNISSKEKLKKHPVYFSAKIDIDEIQRHREEYGIRGASLKSFRIEQESAARRTEEMFNEETDESKISVASLLKGTSNLTASLNTFNSSVTTASTNVLSFPKQPIPSVTSQTELKPQFSFSAPDNKNTTQNNTSFSFGTSSKSEPVSLPSFPVTNTTSSTTTLPSFNFGASAPVSSSAATSAATSVIQSVSFKFPVTVTLTTTSVATLPTVSSSLITSVTSTATSNLFPTVVTSENASAKFSFNGNISSSNNNGQTNISTLTNPTAPSFNFGAVISTQANTSAAAQFTFTPASISSSASNTTNFFAQKSAAPVTVGTASSTQASVFGFQQSPLTKTVSQFPTITSTLNAPSNAFAPTVNTLNQSKSGFSFTATTSTTPSFNFSSVTTANHNVPSFGTTSQKLPSFGTANQNGPKFGTVSQNPPSFGTSNQNLPSFGTSNQTPASFGTANSKPLTFGAVTTSSAPSFNFGVAPASSATSTSTNIFSGFGAKPTTTVAPSIFSNQPTQSSLGTATFNNPSTNSFFGSTVTQTQSNPPPSVFENTGSAGGNIFGQQPTTTPSFFNQPTNSTGFQFKSNIATTQSNSGGFNFNSSNTAPFGSKPQNSAPSFFGASSNAASTTPFGNANNAFGSANNNANPFNASAPSTKPSGFDFSSSVKQTPSFLGGGNSTSGFGAQPPKPSFNFNSQPAPTPTFGAPSTPSFMQTPQQNPFGGAPSTPNFGATPSFATTPSFGGGFSMGTGNVANREKARPRRRKR